MGSNRPAGALHLVTGSTDGYLAFWGLNNDKLQLHHVQRAHQNSIKCLATVSLESSEADYLVFTGGDDNGLAVTRVNFQEGIRTSTLLLPRAHTAAVTAITVLSNQVRSAKEESSTAIPSGPSSFTVLTTSNDQRVKTWDFFIDVEAASVDGIEVKRAVNNYTPVADASCIALIPGHVDRGPVGVLICGVGMDIWWAARRQ